MNEADLKDCPNCGGEETAVFCVEGYYSCTDCGHDFNAEEEEDAST